MNTMKFYPQSVVWEITFACNMNCLHCGTAAGKKRPNELTTQEALDLIDELADLGTTEITLSGGEPLLRKDWRQLAERIVQRGINCLMITNGYAVTEEIAKDFKRLGFNNVGVSLDGTEKTHNYIRRRPQSFQRATAALRMMAETGGYHFCALSSISNLNFDDLEGIRDIIIDCGCKLWRIQMVTGTGRMSERPDQCLTLDRFPEFVAKINEFKKDDRIKIDVGENIGHYGNGGYELLDGMPFFGCYAGMRVVGIESDGAIKGCLSMPEEFVEGNIRDSSFTEIWNNPDNFAYNRRFTRETARGFCHDCKYLPLCRGGCTTTSYAASGCRADNPYCIYRMECEAGIPQPEDIDIVTDYLNRFKTVEVK